MSRRKSEVRWFITLSTFLAFAVFLIPAAEAQQPSLDREPSWLDREPASTRPAAERADNARHCVATLESTGTVGGFRIGTAASLDCYDTFSDAIFAATDGHIWLSDRDDFATQLEVLVAEFQRISSSAVVIDDPDATFVLAVDYDDPDFGPPTLTWKAGKPCTSSRSWVVDSMPDGWNDRVGSTLGGNADCSQNRLYEHINRTGAVLTCTPTCASLGVMNNQASSRRWDH